MTLPTTGSTPRTEVGVRQLHDRLSHYVQEVQAGMEVIVTMRGKPVARLSGIDERDADPLVALRSRGIISEPGRPRTPVDRLPPPITPRGSVSELVSEQRD